VIICEITVHLLVIVQSQHLSFMYITCKISTVNLTLIDNQIVSPETSDTDYDELLTIESGCSWVEAAMNCLRVVSDGMVSVESGHTNFNSYLQI
jgi:hypothetical protein